MGMKGKKIKPPRFVAELVEKYRGLTGLHDGLHAWGTAKKNDGTKLYWVSYSSFGGLFQIQVSSCLNLEEISKISSICDRLGRSWKANTYWICVSDDWIFPGTEVSRKEEATIRYMNTLFEEGVFSEYGIGDFF